MTIETTRNAPEVVVVGAGPAGLAAATWMARAGARTVLLEKAPEPGGRAMTSVVEGAHLNLGPHALYLGGPARALLDELGVMTTGGTPAGEGSFAYRNGRLHTLPGGPWSLLTTGLLGLSAKVELARLLASIGRVRTEGLARISLEEWLRSSLRHEDARQLARVIFRVSTYCADFERLSAAAAIVQVQRALGTGVRYVDGGWSTIVDQLRAQAIAAGVQLRTSARVTGIERAAGESDESVHLTLASGEMISARAAVLAVEPEHAAEWLPSSAASRLRALRPVRAACLDLVLRALPQPRRLVAFGVDAPLYASVHTYWAKLADGGTQVVHLAKYLMEDADAANADRELEQMFDVLQPGWREQLIHRRFLPKMTVMHALPGAEQGGLAGRPSPRVDEMPGVFLAGDWVGHEGMLLDAALSSARAASSAVSEHLRRGLKAAPWNRWVAQTSASAMS